MLFEKIKKEILKCTKNRKINSKKRNPELDYFDYGLNSYLTSGRTIGYRSNKNKEMVRIIKPFKFGPEFYKLELILDSNFAICIDNKKVQVYTTPTDRNQLWSDDNIPIFESYNLSKEDFFHLSIEYDNILTSEQIDVLRGIMKKHSLNKHISVYATPVIVAGLVPWTW